MKLYTGIVEDSSDPLKLGRVRVRVFGVHSIWHQVDDLPWASVLHNGLTSSVLLPSTCVCVMFLDAAEQHPIVFGALNGIAGGPNAKANDTNRGEVLANSTKPSTDILPKSVSDNTQSTSVLTDSTGSPVLDGSGKPISAGNPSPPTITTNTTGEVDVSKLGKVSAKHESNGNPATINRYSDGADLGGASYGSYQFASYLKAKDTPTRSKVTLKQTQNSPVLQFIRSAGLTQFNGLSPATPEFDSAWRTWASDKPTATAIIHKYIEKEYYQAAISKLPTSITNRGVAVHEMIWSMSVQLSPGSAARKIKSVVGTYDPTVCDSAVVRAVYNSRIETVASDFSSSPQHHPGLIKRFKEEMQELIIIATKYETNCTSGAVVTKESDKIVYEGTDKKTVPEAVTVPNTPSSPNTVIYSDFSPKPEHKDSRYVKDYGDVDTSKLARGVITHTPVTSKRAQVIGGRTAGTINITEPTTQYNALYPHNKVYTTETGHIVEFDDTPGYERIHVYHKSGTFVEFHPDGKLVTKVVNDNTVVVNNDNNTITIGNTNSSTDGNKNETIKGNINLVVYGNIVNTVYGNIEMTASGKTKIKSSKIELN